MGNNLLKLAVLARENAYAPYSQFRVGAALQTAGGNTYTGCNIENQSYSLTICAERTAVFKAVSEGNHAFETLAIVADTEEPITPCGACRQVLAEFNPELLLILGTVKGLKKEVRLSELFPAPFQMKD